MIGRLLSTFGIIFTQLTFQSALIFLTTIVLHNRNVRPFIFDLNRSCWKCVHVYFHNNDIYVDISKKTKAMLLYEMVTLYHENTSTGFDCIPLLGLNIPTEFALSDSSKTAPKSSCKLRVKSWLRLDNLTDFYCWIFFVLKFIFHFSIFTYSIKTLF